MNRKEAIRRVHQFNALESLGFTADEAEKLRRISMTLRRWHELECGDAYGYIDRDDKTNRPYWVCSANGSRFKTPDRETGARKRLAAILKGKPVSAYIQTDPRGAALYILRPGDVPEGEDVSAYYSRGICVY